MKTKNLLFAMLSLLTMAACSPKGQSVENPYFESTQTMSMDVRKVEMKDSATIVSVDVYQQPENWISFTSRIHLLADGKKYAIRKVEGAEIDQYFWMPESGEASFKVIFEPLPKGTASVDFIEGNSPNDWNVYGIDLTGKKKFEAAKGVPAELIKATTQNPEELPAPEFNIGETTLKIHLLNNRKGNQPKLHVYLNTILGTQEDMMVTKYVGENEMELKFWQFGLADAFFECDEMFLGNAFLKAGETADIYLDMGTNVYYVLEQREMSKGVKCPIERPQLYSNGAYAQMHGWEFEDMGKYMMQIRTSHFADYQLTADEYTDKIIQQYHALSDSINKSELSTFQKEMLTISLKQTVVVATAEGDRLRFNNALYINNKERSSIEIDKMTEKHFAKVAALFDVIDPCLVWGQQYTDYCTSFTQSDYAMPYWPDAAETEKTVYGILGKHNDLMMKIIDEDPLTNQDLKKIKAIDNDFVRNMLLKKNELNLAALKTVEDKAVIEKTPDVAPEQLFEAIIAPYKGKVILVDFWNTWCAPCRMAIKEVEPLKSTELKSDDLVWIYLADETSPLAKYKAMIPNIQGKHFRLTKKQWRVIADHFNIQSIPSYVLVNKDGTSVYRKDLRDHEQLKQTLKKLIE